LGALGSLVLSENAVLAQREKAEDSEREHGQNYEQGAPEEGGLKFLAGGRIEHFRCS
jgi:hypothetical protein